MTWFPPTYADWQATQPAIDPEDETQVLHADRLPEDDSGKHLLVQIGEDWCRAAMVLDATGLDASLTDGERWATQATWRGWIRSGLITHKALALALGAPQAHVDAMPDPNSLDKQKAALVNKTKALRTAKMNGPCATTFGTASFAPDARTDLLGQLLKAQMSIQASDSMWRGSWKMDGAGRVSFTAADMISFAAQVGAFVEDRFNHGEDLLEAIEAAATQAELDAIDIDAGWP